MPPTLEGLPTEVLQDISAILDTDHPTSLLSFARASKRCYAVASTALFRTVKVAIADANEQAPFQFVRNLETRLLRDDAFGHVRRLILCVPEDSDNPVNWPYSSLISCERGFEDDTGLYNFWDKSVAKSGLKELSIAEHEWEPVIRLLERLPGLVDLYWVRPEQLPMCLLNVLHSKARLCRLHHYTFKFGSPIERSLTRYEHALLASPCLYSIGRLDVDLYDDDRVHDKGEGLVSGRGVLAPNLRRVYLCFDSDGIEPDDIVAKESRLVRLPLSREVIEIGGRGCASIPFSMVQAEASGNTSALRVLTLHQSLALQGLPSPSDFPSLITLDFICAMDGDATPQDWDELAFFLRNLPCLTTLGLQGWDRSISFTHALNPNLRALELRTWSPSRRASLRDDHIHRLADLCPNIDTLSIELRRSRGDAAEVARYQALGRLPRLQELRLELFASPPGLIQTATDSSSENTSDTTIEPWFDAQDAKYLQHPLAPYRQGHFRDALVNSAIDEDLAASIFEVISDAKSMLPGQPSPLPLERLEVKAFEGSCFPRMENVNTTDYAFLCMFNALSVQWAVQRDVRDDARHVVHVSDVHRMAFVPTQDFGEWLAIWRRVWPEKEGVNWWEDWKSRPLLGDGGSMDGC